MNIYVKQRKQKIYWYRTPARSDLESSYTRLRVISTKLYVYNI